MNTVKASGLDLLLSEPLESVGQLDEFYRNWSDKQNLIEQKGIEDTDKFQKLFENALEIDYSDYLGLCKSDPSTELFQLVSAYRYRLKDTAAVKEAWEAANKLNKWYSEKWNDRLKDSDFTCAGFVWQIADTSSEDQINALIAYQRSPTANYGDVWNIINFHKHYFPNGNGTLSYRKLKSFADTVDWGEWREHFPALVYGYLDIVKEQEIKNMQIGAWDTCEKLDESSSAEKLACYREFVSIFPNSEYLEEATNNISHLDNQVRCQVPAAVWQYMSDSTDVGKLREFASKHSKCPESNLALERINEIEGG